MTPRGCPDGLPKQLHNGGERTPGLRPEGKYPGKSPPRRSRQGRFFFFCPVRLGVAVAQLVECRIVIPVVAGSSPVGHPQAHFPQKAGLPGYVKRTVARNGGNVRAALQTSSFTTLESPLGFRYSSSLPLGCRQVGPRHWVLIPAFVGSNPTTPAIFGVPP